MGRPITHTSPAVAARRSDASAPARPRHAPESPPRAGKPVLHKVPLPSATATQFRSAAASHKIPDRQWRGAPAPVGFAPSRRGRGRRVSRSQVKVQTRRITGPAPRPGDARGCASATCAEHSPTPHSKTVSAAWERLPYKSHAERRRPAKNPSAACNRLPSSGARCLLANYGERADFSQNRRIRCFSLPVGCSHSEGWRHRRGCHCFSPRQRHSRGPTWAKSSHRCT